MSGRGGNGEMYYVYLLRCGDGSLYAGITTDLTRRLAEHQGQGGKGAKYTTAHRAVQMEGAWTAADRSAASRLEYRIKHLNRAEKERLLLGQAPDCLDLTGYTRLSMKLTGGIREMLFVCYPKCSTSAKAKVLLDARGLSYDSRDIKEERPTEAELRAWHAKSGLPLKRFFNTSGLVYKALGLSAKLTDMSEDEQFALLATDGMLVKRPILVGDEFVLVGFRESQWEEKL